MSGPASSSGDIVRIVNLEGDHSVTLVRPVPPTLHHILQERIPLDGEHDLVLVAPGWTEAEAAAFRSAWAAAAGPWRSAEPIVETDQRATRVYYRIRFPAKAGTYGEFHRSNNGTDRWDTLAQVKAKLSRGIQGGYRGRIRTPFNDFEVIEVTERVSTTARVVDLAAKP